MENNLIIIATLLVILLFCGNRIENFRGGSRGRSRGRSGGGSRGRSGGRSRSGSRGRSRSGSRGRSRSGSRSGSRGRSRSRTRSWSRNRSSSKSGRTPIGYIPGRKTYKSISKHRSSGKRRIHGSGGYYYNYPYYNYYYPYYYYPYYYYPYGGSYTYLYDTAPSYLNMPEKLTEKNCTDYLSQSVCDIIDFNKQKLPKKLTEKNCKNYLPKKVCKKIQFE